MILVLFIVEALSQYQTIITVCQLSNFLMFYLAWGDSNLFPRKHGFYRSRVLLSVRLKTSQADQAVREDPEVLELAYIFLETVLQVVREVLEVLFDLLFPAAQEFQENHRLPCRLWSKNVFAAWIDSHYIFANHVFAVTYQCNSKAAIIDFRFFFYCIALFCDRQTDRFVGSK